MWGDSTNTTMNSSFPWAVSFCRTRELGEIIIIIIMMTIIYMQLVRMNQYIVVQHQLLEWTPPRGGSGRSEPADDGVLAVQSAQRRCGGPDRRGVTINCKDWAPFMKFAPVLSGGGGDWGSAYPLLEQGLDIYQYSFYMKHSYTYIVDRISTFHQ